MFTYKNAHLFYFLFQRTREQTDDDENVQKSSNKKPIPTKTNITKKMKTIEIDPVVKRQRSEMFKSYMNRGGPSAHGSKTIPDGEKNCLKDLTFVITGK